MKLTTTNRHCLKEGVSLIDTLPEDIISKVLLNKTSLRDNPSIPNIFDSPYILKLLEKYFKSIKATISDLDLSEDDEDDVNLILSKSIAKCMEIERPIRNQLERICMDYVIDLFNVPSETVDISVSLVDEVDLNSDTISLEPINDDEFIEFNSINDAMHMRTEVYKRRMLDALCMGGALSLSSEIDTKPFASEIKSLNEELLPLYKKIVTLNQYLLFTKEDIGMTDKKKMQLGTVEVRLGQMQTKNKILAQGKIFPVLLSELIHGFLELFVSHGLPSNRELALNVIGKSDFLKAEPWDMRLGPSLWQLFIQSIKTLDSKELPYLLQRVSKLETKKFNYLMKEVLIRTKKGAEIMSYISKKAKEDLDYCKFCDKMDKAGSQNSVIIDNYLHLEDLENGKQR